MTKAQGLLQFYRHYKLATRRCLPTKCIVNPLLNHCSYIIVSDILSRSLIVDKHSVLVRLIDDISTIFNTESLASLDELSPVRVKNTILTNKKSSTIRLFDGTTIYWRGIDIHPDDYIKFRRELLNMLKPYASMHDAKFWFISTIKHCVVLYSPHIWQIESIRTTPYQNPLTFNRQRSKTHWRWLSSNQLKQSGHRQSFLLQRNIEPYAPFSITESWMQ